MKITVWGSRGSIPVSGQQYVKYGGDTTCIEIETAAGETIILDAGSGIRALGSKMIAEGKKEFHFIFSHAHWDHLLGFPFFKPLYRKDSILRFYGCTFSQGTIKKILQDTMKAPYFPVEINAVQADLRLDVCCDRDFEVGGLCCESIPLNHPNGGCGYRFYEGDKSVAIFPDNELSSPEPDAKPLEDFAEFCSGADLLIHDGEYLKEEYEAFSKGWGHSVFLDTVELGLKANVKHLVLFHLNQDHNDDKIDAITETACGIIKDAGSDMICENARTG
ncbi:MAG: MBL fold metallo-hydrolase, partial [Planctomycetota bacterium]